MGDSSIDEKKIVPTLPSFPKRITSSVESIANEYGVDIPCSWYDTDNISDDIDSCDSAASAKPVSISRRLKRLLQEEERCNAAVYGGCEGPDAMYVKLISSDGHEFIVKREHALTSGTIKAMLSGPGQFAENETNEIHFREIPSHVLQKVCMYFTYKVRYTNSSTEIPEFPIAPQVALELLMAANFLDC
ncbi:hypothetical protein O3M35_005877 [Rhynocoris fuscipes]|uniref:Elongin-C n=1 Tax=Rhynocoris fuscipes TaxID=488301 RepID=A0AAW1DQN2_9HEMI